jgi:hypothetical protein
LLSSTYCENQSCRFHRIPPESICSKS